MKKILLGIVYFSIVSIICAVGNYQPDDKYINGQISEITISYYRIDAPNKFPEITKKRFSYLEYGLFWVETIKNQMIIIEPTNRNEIAFGFGLYYNESHNNNISSPIRLNERIAIPFYSNGGMTFDYVSETVFIHNVKLTFDNTNHRLKYYRGMNRINSDLEYDDFGRLINVYQVVDDKKILRKAIYYDGILRHIEKPYYIEPYPELSNTPPDFIDQHSKGLEEIVIYDDRILKYVVHLHRRDNRMIDRRGISTPEQLKQLEQYLFLITYEYDDNLNLTKETRIYDEDFKELKGDNYIR